MEGYLDEFYVFWARFLCGCSFVVFVRVLISVIALLLWASFVLTFWCGKSSVILWKLRARVGAGSSAEAKKSDSGVSQEFGDGVRLGCYSAFWEGSRVLGRCSGVKRLIRF